MVSSPRSWGLTWTCLGLHFPDDTEDRTEQQSWPWVSHSLAFRIHLTSPPTLGPRTEMWGHGAWSEDRPLTNSVLEAKGPLCCSLEVAAFGFDPLVVFPLEASGPWCRHLEASLWAGASWWSRVRMSRAGLLPSISLLPSLALFLSFFLFSSLFLSPFLWILYPYKNCIYIYIYIYFLFLKINTNWAPTFSQELY